jgi:hypothetical protein
MMDPFNRAEQYRARAEELRTIAEHMSARDAKASLIAIADGLDHHARNLETTG